MTSSALWTPPSHLWEPQKRGILATIDAIARGNHVCLYGPTGSGKTECAVQLLQWALDQGCAGSFYVNRKLLVHQTAERFTAKGLPFGIRAADYEDYYDYDAPIQICSADTERSRVYQRGTWKRHPSQLVIVDEAHIQKGDTMRQILDDHRKRGAATVLLTATPIGLSDWADELVISGKLQEYRDCNAIVPAVVKSIEQPDLRKVKRNATGEYVLDGRKRQIYTQSIVANVLDRWKKYNPDARPTMLYAPGKPESVWLTEQFVKMGVNWCHVDATDAVVDGIRVKLTRPLWEEILARYKAGDIKGLSSRFKLREGIDAPNTYCCILATPIGSLASYIQTVGRVLRYSAETPDQVIVIDHGGNYWRHGSPNHDRPWDVWWNLPEHYISDYHLDQVREKKKPEPIRCPKCETERVSGIKCPVCGHTHEKSKRHIIMEDGELREVDGHLVKPKFIRRKPDTEEKWSKMFWGYRNKKLEKSFKQMEAFFAHEYGYFPPRDIPYMPIEHEHWCRPVYKVELSSLTGKSTDKVSA